MMRKEVASRVAVHEEVIELGRATCVEFVNQAIVRHVDAVQQMAATEQVV